MNRLKEKRKIMTILLVPILALAMLLSCVGIISLSSVEKADALLDANISADSKKEMLLDGYKSTGNVFDGKIFWSIMEKISGGKVKNKSTMKTWSLAESYWLDCVGLRAKNGGDDIVVTIDGKQWVATYLSSNDNGEPILTFWLANSNCVNADGSSYQASWDGGWWEGFKYYGKNTANLYGTSYMRAVMLNNSAVDENGARTGKCEYSTSSTVLTTHTQVIDAEDTPWAKFTVPNDMKMGGKTMTGSLMEFIEVPKNMSWQQNQVAKDYVASLEYNSCNNDALNAGGDSSSSSGDYLSKFPDEDKHYYSAWGTDTLWLPSVAETGVSGNEGIWNTSDSIRANSADTWLRSASPTHFERSYKLYTDGSGAIAWGIDGIFAVRPAFHLNLRAAGAKAGPLGAERPSDIECVYNGKTWTLGDILDGQGWYDEDIVDVTPTNFSQKDIGKYTLTATIKDSVLNDDLDFEFKGTPDVDKGETTTKRVFTFEITPKLLSVSWKTAAGNEWTTSDQESPIPTLDDGEICSNDSGVKDTVTLNLKYSGKTSTGATYPNTSKGESETVAPKNAGNYTVTIQSLSNSNYDFAIGVVKSKTFELPIRKIAPLAVNNLETTKWEYTASNKTIIISNYIGDYVLKGQGDESTASVIISVATHADDNNADLIKIIDNETIQIVDKGQAGTYYLLLTLVDTDNTQWADKSENAADKTTPREVSFTITQKELTGSITAQGLTNGKITVEEGGKPTIRLEMTDFPLGSDSISIDVNAYRGSNTKAYELAKDVIIAASDNGSKLYYEITLDCSKLPITGDYRVEFALTDKTGYANKNYTLNIPALTIDLVEEVDDGNFTWRLDGIAIIKSTPDTKSVTYDDSVESYSTLPYDGSSHTISVTLPSGYSVVNSYTGFEDWVSGYKYATQTDAGTYTAYVRVSTPSGDEDYSITWTIDKATFDLSGVKWKNVVNGVSQYEYTGSPITPGLDNVPTELTYDIQGIKNRTAVGSYGEVEVVFGIANGYNEDNYILPMKNGSYDCKFSDWTIDWEIVKAKINIIWNSKTEYDVNNLSFDTYELRNSGNITMTDVIAYEYYETDENGNIKDMNNHVQLSDIVVDVVNPKYYKVKAVILDTAKGNYEFPADSDLFSRIFQVGGTAQSITLSLEKDEYVYTGREVSLQWASNTPTGSLTFKYYEGDSTVTELSGTPKDAGTYTVVVTSNSEGVALSGTTQFTFTIAKNEISTDWNMSGKPPVLNLTKGIQLTEGVEYEYYDADNHKISFSDLSKGGTFKIRAVINDRKNFIFDNGEVETEMVEFTVVEGEALRDPSDISNPNYNFTDDEGNQSSGNTTGSGDTSGNDSNGGAGTLDEILKKLKEIPLWQLIASVISIILIIIFVSKTVKYDGERKKFNKKSDKLEKSIMAVAPFLGIAESGWTTIACVLMVLAVATFIIMLVVKKARNKAEEEYEDLLDEYSRNQKNLEESKRAEEKENMRMMLMGMMGGNNGGQGGYAGGYGLGADEIRGIVSDTMTALLPGMQQLLPQQASSNDELVQKLIEQNAQNEERVDKLIQQLVARPVEREVASAISGEDILKVVEKTEHNDETIKQLLKNQEVLMQKIVELSANGNSQPQVVEKVVEVPVEVEKIVEVPVEVEKIVEKEVVKEVSVVAPPKPKKEVAPRLTLDEAYALLSKTQKEFFDGLKAYALSKDKSKELKSTYAITLGQSTVNPLVKLTIKKDTTVALYKMEDEYLKDIKRDASGDGTKLKVKETELVVADAQAFDTAKKMVDLREDQLERYQDLLKEQRSTRSKK